MLRLAMLLLLAGYLPRAVTAQTAGLQLSSAQDGATSHSQVNSVADDALLLLAQHQAVVGDVEFKALQATGTITLAGSNVPLPARLVMSKSSFVRVWISNGSRLTGFAVDGPLHRSYYADGTSTIDAVDTNPASVSAFQLLRASDVSHRLLGLQKDKVTDASGKQYDRLRARHAVFLTTDKSAYAAQKGVAVDYYFDPATHDLMKSVTSLHVPGILNAIPLETLYSDYRLVGTSKLPFRIKQVLNGQSDWVLELTSAKLLPSLDASETAF